MENTLGDIIAQKRKEKHLTQTQLAERFGITDKAVSKWERNLSKPDEKFMPKLVEILGLPVEYLPNHTKRIKGLNVVFDVVFKDFIRIFCVGVMLATVVCFSADYLTVESTIVVTGCAAAVFAFITLLKS